MAKKEKVEATQNSTFHKPTERDFEVILKPVITEKSNDLMGNQNKVTLRVDAKANKTEIKLAFERLYQAKVVDVKVVNVRAKKASRGGRYPGHLPGYKKAIITINKGEAIDLYKD